MISEMKGIEDEKRRLKKMYAELRMQNELLKEALGKNSPAIPASGYGRGCCDATRCQYRAPLPDRWGQRDVLPLPAEARC